MTKVLRTSLAMTLIFTLVMAMFCGKAAFAIEEDVSPPEGSGTHAQPVENEMAPENAESEAIESGPSDDTLNNEQEAQETQEENVIQGEQALNENTAGTNEEAIGRISPFASGSVTSTDGLWTATFYNPAQYVYTNNQEATFFVDFAGPVSLQYNGTKTGDYLLTICDMGYNVLLDGNNSPYAYETPVTNTTAFDFSIVAETEFIAIYHKHIPQNHFLPDTWSISFNNEKITADTTVDRTLNPHQIVNTSNRPEAVIDWIIKDADNEIVLSGTGALIDQTLLDALPDGVYSVSIVANGQTKYGNPLSAQDSDTFVILKPQANVYVEKPTNPDIVTVNKKLPDSNLSWVLKDSQGNIVDTGMGNDVPVPTELGVYTIEATETSVDGLVSTASGTFEIVAGTIDKEGDADNDDQATVNPLNPLLPQTGDGNVPIAFLGVLAGLLGALSLLAFRKKRPQR